MEFQLFHKLYFNAKEGSFSKVTAREEYDSQITLTDREADMIIDYFGKENIHTGAVALNPNKAKKEFVLYSQNKTTFLNLIYPKPNKTELRLYISIKAGFKPKNGEVWFLFINQSNILTIGSLLESNWNTIGQTDEFDYVYQDEIEEISDIKIDINKIPDSKIEKRIINGREIYNRNSAFGKIRFVMNNYKCEVNPLHETFLRDKDRKPFLESHHLIPMYFQNKIIVPLDDIGNIVSLCPNCHRGVHHGISEHKIYLLNSLLKTRSTFHDFSYDNILSFYNCLI